jgi:hypothetical protein
LNATRNFPVGAISALMGECANEAAGFAVAIRKTINNKTRRMVTSRLRKSLPVRQSSQIPLFIFTKVSCSKYRATLELLSSAYLIRRGSTVYWDVIPQCI